jgi:hypothetical protein
MSDPQYKSQIGRLLFCSGTYFLACFVSSIIGQEMNRDREVGFEFYFPFLLFFFSPCFALFLLYIDENRYSDSRFRLIFGVFGIVLGIAQICFFRGVDMILLEILVLVVTIPITLSLADMSIKTSENP